MPSNATIEMIKNEANDFATVWVTAYEEARNVVMAKGLPEVPVLHCAEQVADEVFNRYMQRIEEGEVS